MSTPEDVIREALDYLHRYAMLPTESPPIEGDGQRADAMDALAALVRERDEARQSLRTLRDAWNGHFAVCTHPMPTLPAPSFEEIASWMNAPSDTASAVGACPQASRHPAHEWQGEVGPIRCPGGCRVNPGEEEKLAAAVGQRRSRAMPDSGQGTKQGDHGFVPIALACGHVVQEMARFEYDPDRVPRTLVECPEGCGWQGYIVEPGEDGGCLCESPFHHVCGREVTVVDLGTLEKGDEVEIGFGREDGAA